MTAPRRVTRIASAVRADNPGPMTLDGTRSYVLRAPGADACVVVDPGPDDTTHLDALAAAGPVALVLVTHRHADHTAGSARLHALTGAPVRAADPVHCHGGRPLVDGETIDVAGVRIAVLATPGHTADSVCLVLPDDGPVITEAEAPGHDARADAATEAGARSGTVLTGATVLTGDTILGQGTTVIAEPDGSLGRYLASLDRLGALVVHRRVIGLPGHGPVIDDLGERVRAYRAHRLERLAQVRAALATLGLAPGDEFAAERVTAHVYADVDPSVLGAARQSVLAQLAFLAEVDRRARPPRRGPSGVRQRDT
ncbi:MBL fold metallo-hydrolase [Cellulosimicrobium sp. Marseille-Q4280]|uniref:MBL fold metallo-hydrolase n=1 Tax=Cellulosimicrobium sp. Marseille-Q4280 TaxID=2937992 RepID=UPI00203FDFBC|nr:MBL fold metallo-hydrolase [Cellulosimicrobium sp. Marseille-Q4280]